MRISLYVVILYGVLIGASSRLNFDNNDDEREGGKVGKDMNRNEKS